MPKAFCNSTSSFFSKPLISVPLPLLSHSQFSSFAFPPTSLLSQQLPGGISSQFPAHICISYFISTLSSMTLPNLPFSQDFSQAASILDFDMWALFYIPVATCHPFCLLESQLIIISSFLSPDSASLFILSLFLHHLHDSSLSSSCLPFLLSFSPVSRPHYNTIETTFENIF